MQKAALLVALFVLALTGCDNSDPGGNSGETVTGSPRVVKDDGFFLTIDEVGLGPHGYVALTNFTDSRASLEDLFLCQPPRCFALPDAEIEPGGTALVAAGDSAGAGHPVAAEAPLELSPSDGEVALYASRDVDDPDAIRAYLEWGSTPHEGTSVAVEAGLWLEGSYAPTSKDATRLFQSDDGLWLFDAP